MSLRDANVEPAVPVSDIAQAREFYETKLVSCAFDSCYKS